MKALTQTIASPTFAAAAFRACIVVPYYNHPHSIAAVLATLRPLGLPCFIVDDASNAEGRLAIDNLLAREGAWLTLLRHENNRGKGGAVMTGCDAAYAGGFTHALQIDADGQHDAADVPKLLQLAQAHSHALITGTPIYDDSVPRSRLYGRYLTHVWVWINTLSLEIRDSMCGLRVYPLREATRLWRSVNIGKRMDFDTEVMVRLVWRGVRVIGVPTRVRYPSDGISHFDVWRDNVRISWMHARLFVGMLWRAPLLLARRVGRLVRKTDRAVA